MIVTAHSQHLPSRFCNRVKANVLLTKKKMRRHSSFAVNTLAWSLGQQDTCQTPLPDSKSLFGGKNFWYSSSFNKLWRVPPTILYGVRVRERGFLRFDHFSNRTVARESATRQARRAALITPGSPGRETCNGIPSERSPWQVTGVLKLHRGSRLLVSPITGAKKRPGRPR